MIPTNNLLVFFHHHFHFIRICILFPSILQLFHTALLERGWYIRRQRKGIKRVIAAVHAATDNLSPTHRSGMHRHLIRVLEPRVLTPKGEQHIACGSLTMLGDDNLCHAMQVVSFLVLIDMVILGTMYKEHHVGILLDGSRFTQIAQLGTLSLQTLTVFHRTVELRERQDGDIQFLGQSLQ